MRTENEKSWDDAQPEPEPIDIAGQQVEQGLVHEPEEIEDEDELGDDDEDFDDQDDDFEEGLLGEDDE